VEDLKNINSKVGFIGAGNMASALIYGLVKKGFSPDRLYIADLDSEKTASLKKELGVQISEGADQLVQAVDAVVIAVKPGTVAPLLSGFEAGNKLWLSVAAGIDNQQIETALGGAARVVRAMPNTPALVSEGATGLAPGAHATDADIQLASALMGAVGITEVVDEKMMDAVTGLSGSGPAYVMLMIEAMADGAVRAGLPRPIALSFAAQTIRGAATLQIETNTHPGVLKDKVTSPGGTTICGVEALEKAGFRSAVISAVGAAAAQSKRLSGK